MMQGNYFDVYEVLNGADTNDTNKKETAAVDKNIGNPFNSIEESCDEELLSRENVSAGVLDAVGNTTTPGEYPEEADENFTESHVQKSADDMFIAPQRSNNNNDGSENDVPQFQVNNDNSTDNEAGEVPASHTEKEPTVVLEDDLVEKLSEIRESTTIEYDRPEGFQQSENADFLYEQTYSTGTVASILGLSEQTVRNISKWYENILTLKKTLGGHRVYTKETIVQLAQLCRIRQINNFTWDQTYEYVVKGQGREIYEKSTENLKKPPVEQLVEELSVKFEDLLDEKLEKSIETAVRTALGAQAEVYEAMLSNQQETLKNILTEYKNEYAEQKMLEDSHKKEYTQQIEELQRENESLKDTNTTLLQEKSVLDEKSTSLEATLKERTFQLEETIKGLEEKAVIYEEKIKALEEKPKKKGFLFFK